MTVALDPPPNPPSPVPTPVDQDLEHLRLLAVFHYVVGGLAALVSCLFLFHLGFGLTMLMNPKALGGEPAPTFVGLFMTVLGSIALVCGWTFAACLVHAGRCLARQRSWTFCAVMAGIACAMMPFGTVLGVFTLIVLLRPSVRARFGMPAAAPAAS